MANDSAPGEQIELNRTAHNHTYAAYKDLHSVELDLLGLLVAPQSEANIGNDFELILHELDGIRGRVQAAYDAQFPGEAENAE